jgi:hypothetical protein
MQAGGWIIGDLAEPDAARAAAAILDLDGSDHRHLALMTASTATGDRIVFAAAGDFSLIDLDEAGERAATGGEHAAAQFGAQQPRRLIGAESELTLQLQCRNAIGVGGHQISGPEPGAGLTGFSVRAATAAKPGGKRARPGLMSAPPAVARPRSPPELSCITPSCGKVLSTGRLVAKALLELEQGARKLGHHGHRKQLGSLFVLIRARAGRYKILCSRTHRDKPSPQNTG